MERKRTEAEIDAERLERSAEDLYQGILEELPGIERVRPAEPSEDSGLPGDPAIDRVVYRFGRHSFCTQVTTASTDEKLGKMIRQLMAMPEVQTSKLVDYGNIPDDPVRVPRFNIRIPIGMMLKYDQEPQGPVRSEIEAIIRKQTLQNFVYFFNRLEVHPATGAPLNPEALERVMKSPQYRELVSLLEVFGETRESLRRKSKELMK